MPRFLSLDWDHQLLQVVEAQVGRGGVQIQRAAAWQEESSPNPAEAEEQGKRLAERLKQAGIAPGPVLVAVARDRFILKDVRYPQVPASEEPAIVRFQAAKELTYPVEEVVIDYAPAAEPGPNGERRALTVVLRRELLQTYQTLCRAAGLKLAALTPRPFGIAACVQAAHLPSLAADPLGPAASPGSDGGAVAVLTLTGGWAEFAVVRAGKLLFTRAMPIGDGVVGEMRNLALFAGQPHLNAGRDRVQALLVAGNGEHNVLREQLRQLLAIPVQDLDPFAGVERLDLTGNRGGFAGAVGLLHVQAAGSLPVDFAHPKEPRVERDRRPVRYALVGVLGVLALIVLLVVGRTVFLGGQQREIDELQAANGTLDNQLLLLKKDSDNLKQLQGWTGGALPLLDELAVLNWKFPDTKRLQLNEWTVTVVKEQTDNTSPAAKTGPKAPAKKTIAQITLAGDVTGDEREVDRLIARLTEASSDGQGFLYRLAGKNVTAPEKDTPAHFTIKIDVEQPPPKRPQAATNATPPVDGRKS